MKMNFITAFTISRSAALVASMLVVSGAAHAATDPSVVSAAKDFVAKASQPPAAWTGPTSSPAPAKGKKVTLISCLQASDCALDATAMAEAAKAIGWEPTIVDGKGDVSVYNASIRSAVNAGTDGIINIALPAPLIQDGLRFAADKKVPVISAANIVPNDPLIAGSVEHRWADQAAMLLQWIIADGNGKGGIVLLRDDEFPGIKARGDGFADALKKANCPDCKLLADPNLSVMVFINQTQMAQQVQSLVARYGEDLKYIVTPYGSVDGFIAPVLKSLNRTDIKIVSYDGNKQQLQLCQQGSVGAIAVTLHTWAGWAAVDQLNRAFAGQPPAAENAPTFLATTATCTGDNLAEDMSKFDFKSEYLKLWGLSK
jgi:ribose transport system substrate-binding protein